MNYRNIFVSIIVPIYNSKNELERCLISLLSQDYPQDNYEVIVVDDGSNDNSLKLVEKFTVLLIRHNHNKGPAAARNTGISFAKGRLLLFLDSDCIVRRNWISSHVAVHKKREKEYKDTVCVGGPILLPDKVNNFIEISDYYSSWYEQPRIKRELTFEYLPTTNLSIKKEIIDKIGGFKEELKCGEDIEYGIRLRKNGYNLEFEQKIEVFHYGRKNFRDYLSHHYNWGYFAPQFRKFGSGIKYNWLFYPNIVYSLVMVPFISAGYTLYVLYKWFLKGKIIVFFLFPMIFLSKIYFSIGILHGTYRIVKDKKNI